VWFVLTVRATYNQVPYKGEKDGRTLKNLNKIGCEREIIQLTVAEAGCVGQARAV
jgi:hypothetical protein